MYRVILFCGVVIYIKIECIVVIMRNNVEVNGKIFVKIINIYVYCIWCWCIGIWVGCSIIYIELIVFKGKLICGGVD